jgi:GTPase SAR1 family protein
MIIGKENVGKTTLRKRLIASSNSNRLNIIPNSEPMTHGIDIESWKDDKRNTLFSIWDFAYYFYFCFICFKN